jgi:uncharacterized membrane-anchored protein
MRIDSKTFALSEVPQVTLAFWVVKILATTGGETGGDALSMTLNLGYAVSSLIFIAFFVPTLTAEVSSRISSSLVMVAAMIVVIALTSFRRPAGPNPDTGS